MFGVSAIRARVAVLENRLCRHRYEFGYHREQRLEDRVSSLESKLDCLIAHLGLTSITVEARVQPEHTYFHPKEASK